MRFPAHTLDTRRYTETFGIFMTRSHEYTAVIDQLVEAAGRCPPNYACLDVGAGTGNVILDWQSRGSRLPKRYVAIEPFAEHARSLKKNLADLEIDTLLVEAEFAPDFTIPGTFDLIVFSHSCYWLRDPVQCLINAHQSLNPDGTLVAILQSPIGAYPFFRLFNPLLNRDRPAGPDHGLSSHELANGLRDAGLQPIVKIESSWLELTGIFADSARSERDEFISFLLQAEFSQMDERLKSDVIEYLRAACVEVDGKLVWHHPTASVRLDA